MALSNSGTIVRAALDRILNLQAEIDTSRECLKDLRTELKSRQDEIGVSPADLFRAAALHRKGASEAAGKLAATIDLLRSAGLDEDAADLALA